jgi:hypothetical protein
MEQAAQKNKKWSKRHKRYLRLCYKTKARRVAGLYLTLLCGYLASVARETHCSFPMHILAPVGGRKAQYDDWA